MLVPPFCSSASNQSKVRPGFAARCSWQSGWLTLHPANVHVNIMGIGGGRSEPEGFPGRLRMPTMKLSVPVAGRIAAPMCRSRILFFAHDNALPAIQVGFALSYGAKSNSTPVPLSY
jgi:hypothetical protein